VLPYALEHEALLAKPWRGIYMPHPTWMGRLSWFKKNKYQTPPNFCSEDQELLLRASNSSRYATIDEILFAYRVRDSISLTKSIKTRLAILKLQFNYFIKHQSFLNGLMSVIFFPVKVAIDLFTFCSGGSGKFRYAKADALEIIRWNLNKERTV
jgi:hypothetical protein